MMNKIINVIEIILAMVIAVLVLYLYIIVQPIMYKPVLYIYPTQDMNVSIKFEKPGLLLTTYPKYNKEWKYFVKKDGTIIDNKKSYYALYWEEKIIKKETFNTGFYVTKDKSIEFLEEKLAKIGLTDREKNEFIMYWLPVLEKNQKNLIHFDFTEEIENNNKLIIDPKPDSLLRVHIYIKKVNKKIDIKEQKIEQFNRTGYSIIEWGGTIIK